MNLKVQKYGGTSVGTLERIQRVAQHIKTTLATTARLVVVVSAMGDETDKLLEMAYTLSANPVKRELDMLITTGERISMSLLSISLNDIGVKAISLTGSQTSILTDEIHGNARIIDIKTDRLLASLLNYEVVIVAGFQGVSPKTKEITTLGRGGSDLSAVALAIKLKAQDCEIYTDVNGVMTCDPRLSANSKVISKLSWQAMHALSLGGAGVLHHKAAFLASKYLMPVRIKSTFQPHLQGTLIGEQSKVDGAIITAIAVKKNLCLVECEVAADNTFQAHLAKWLLENDQIPQVYTYQFHMNEKTPLISIKLSLDFQLLNSFRKLLSQFNPKLQLKEKLAAITVVGRGFKHNPDILGTMLEKLGASCHQLDVANDSVLAFIEEANVADIVAKFEALCATEG